MPGPLQMLGGHDADGTPVIHLCVACGPHWPCDVTLDAYSTEELEAM